MRYGVAIHIVDHKTLNNVILGQSTKEKEIHAICQEIGIELHHLRLTEPASYRQKFLYKTFLNAIEIRNKIFNDESPFFLCAEDISFVTKHLNPMIKECVKGLFVMKNFNELIEEQKNFRNSL